MNSASRFRSFVFGVFLSASIATSAYPCPFCYSVSTWTLSEQVAEHDVVALVQWHHAVRGVGAKPGTTTFEVLEVLRAPQPGAPPKGHLIDFVTYREDNDPTVRAFSQNKGHLIDFVTYREGKAGDLFLLCGKNANTFIWYHPFKISNAAYDYVKRAPSPQMPIPQRLEYFLNYLEHADPQIAEDAYAEFADVSYQELIAFAPKIPREKVHSWVADPNIDSKRLGLYGKLLGLVGNDDDAEMMAKLIAQPSDDYRPGIDGVMAGYLLLTGEAGLELIEKTKLLDKTVPFETYAAMQALRFMWQHGQGRISQDRLRESMRILLDHLEFTDLVIGDLARWKDWESQERLAALYGEGEYNTPPIKRAIARFMLVSMCDVPKTANDVGTTEADRPEHAVRGEKLLEEIRLKDPKPVSQVEQIFYFPKLRRPVN
ncbi:MAG: hypothetical protein WEB58_13475 [Planctomycetaceae bacterium]